LVERDARLSGGEKCCPCLREGSDHRVSVSRSHAIVPGQRYRWGPRAVSASFAKLHVSDSSVLQIAVTIGNPILTHSAHLFVAAHLHAPVILSHSQQGSAPRLPKRPATTSPSTCETRPPGAGQWARLLDENATFVDGLPDNDTRLEDIDRRNNPGSDTFRLMSGIEDRASMLCSSPRNGFPTSPSRTPTINARSTRSSASLKLCSATTLKTSVPGNGHRASEARGTLGCRL